MILSLVILYVVTLVYLSITERFRHYAALMTYQGWLLLLIALLYFLLSWLFATALNYIGRKTI